MQIDHIFLHRIILAILPTGVLLSLALVVFTWRHRNDPAAGAFIWMLICITFWQVCTFMVSFSQIPSTAIFWLKIGNIGSQLLPVAWLNFSLIFTGRKNRINATRLVLLSIFPIFIISLAWADKF
jgi:hypothetical protein